MTTSIQTDALLARFAMLAYESESFLRDSAHLPTGWRLAVPVTEGPFGAFAFRNDATGQVIVAYRGTDGLSDLPADAAILSGNWSTQFQQGIDLMSALRESRLVFPDGYDRANVLITGHSLGGAIAQAAFGLDGAAMDPGAAGRIAQNPEFAAALASAGLPPGGIGMPNTFMNWVVTDSLVSNASGTHLGATSPVPTLGFSSQQALTTFLVSALNPAAGFPYALATDQFTNKHPSTQISAAMDLLAGIHDPDAEPVALTLNRRVLGYHEGDGSTREPIYSQTEFDVRDAGGNLIQTNGRVADAARGVRSLAWVDANADGRIDAADPVFNELRVWQDADADGVVDAGEARTLAELQVTELDYAQSRFTRAGQVYSMGSPDLEADANGTRVSQVASGIQVEYSDAGARLFITRTMVQTANDPCFVLRAAA